MSRSSAGTDKRVILVVGDTFEFADRNPKWKDQIRPEGYKLDWYLDFAREIEEAGFDAIFSADFLGISRATLEKNTVGPFRLGYVEPLAELSALATVTERIGLIGTFSTQFNAPYQLARQLTSLDTISNGRSGWNIVTSFTGESNFGSAAVKPVKERYERAQEFLGVTTALWTSWKDGAVTTLDADRVKLDGSRIVDIDHHGKYFDVEQALDMAPSPQGVPLLVQAGASEDGIDFAARNAELIFVASPDIEQGRAFYSRVKRLAEAHGRHADDVKIVPGVRIYMGETPEEAQAVYFSSLTEGELEQAREAVLSEIPDLDLTGLDLDDTLTLDRFPTPEAIRRSERRASRALIYRGWIENGTFTTLREFLYRYATSFGHFQIIGTPEQVADEITEWVTTEAADGFVLNGASSFDLLTERVMPILRERGLLPDPDEVKGATLRERLGTKLNLGGGHVGA